MKLCILAAATLAASMTLANAQTSRGYGSPPTYGTGSNPSSNSVEGYTTNRGTYVAPHQQTSPNSTQYDNYGAKGNYNPYNGQTGTRPPKY
jgi:hypothetical protein